jgi:putative DNA primase/helicase
VSEQYLWFLHGAGANGKSTFLNALRRAMGDYAIQLDGRILLASDHEQHPTGLTDLRGVRFAATVEVEQGRHLAESLVKQLTGGDPIRARRMHKDYFEFLPTHKLWVAANHLPQITGTDHAIWRRILLIPFTQTFTGNRVDRDLPAKLAAETPGILAWAVDGCLKWRQDGLQVPERVIAATDDYRANEDHVGRFLADCFVTDDQDYVLASTLRETYVRWCASGGEREWTAQALGRELTSRGYDSVKVGTKRWLGLRPADGLDLRGVA